MSEPRSLTPPASDASSEAPRPPPLSLQQLRRVHKLIGDVLAIDGARRQRKGMDCAWTHRIDIDGLTVMAPTNVVFYLLGCCLADRMAELRELGIRIDPDLLGRNPPPSPAAP